MIVSRREWLSAGLRDCAAVVDSFGEAGSMTKFVNHIDHGQGECHQGNIAKNVELLSVACLDRQEEFARLDQGQHPPLTPST